MCVQFIVWRTLDKVQMIRENYISQERVRNCLLFLFNLANELVIINQAFPGKEHSIVAHGVFNNLWQRWSRSPGNTVVPAS